MPNDVSGELLLPGVDHGELQHLFQQTFGTAEALGNEAGEGRIVRLPRGDRCVLTVRTDSAGVIKTIETGRDWSPAEHDHLVARVRAELLPSDAFEVWASILMGGVPMNGQFSCDQFQIGRASCRERV